MSCRYSRKSDRDRCYRQDNPKPRPDDDSLLMSFGSLTVPQIARELGHNEHTVRSWVWRAINR